MQLQVKEHQETLARGKESLSNLLEEPHFPMAHSDSQPSELQGKQALL